MTGYDLKKILDHPMGFFWVAQMSQIYRELKYINLPKKEKKPS